MKKVTVALPEDLWTRVKLRVVATGETLQELVARCLESCLPDEADEKRGSK